MPKFRVLRDYTFVDTSGKRVAMPAGSIVEVLTRDDVSSLTCKGVIGPLVTSYQERKTRGEPAQPNTRTKRVGFWIHTSRHYSGGRIHMYQFALSLAQNGVETYMITDGTPGWAADYPESKNLKILLEGTDKIPCDLDVVITDSKGGFGRKACEYRSTHPWVKLLAFNFETPNWVKEFVPEYAEKLGEVGEVFEEADELLANSHESAIWLQRWLGRDPENTIGVLPPAVNTHALANAKTTKKLDRPYVVWSARSPKYKGGDVAIEAVQSLPFVCDLVMIGQPRQLPKDTPEHKFVAAERIRDSEKFALMQGAACVLAPSLFEGAGMVPMEALASGTPCIAYDLPVLRELYGDEILYAKWGDREDFKRLVSGVVESSIRHAEQGVDGIKAITQGKSEQAQAVYGLEAMRDRVETMPYCSMRRPKINAHLVSYWGFVPESIESIYPHVDKIFVAFGRVPHAPEVDDGSWERLQSVPDPQNKIAVERRDLWDGGKVQMRRWCTEQMDCNYHLLLDGDEIWTGMDEWLRDPIPYGCPRWVNLWHGPDYWIHDRDGDTELRWGHQVNPFGSWCHHYRWSWWRNSYRYDIHTRVNDADGQRVGSRDLNRDTATAKPETVIYHIGHALPPVVMQAKHEFYLNRDGNDAKRQMRKDAWHEWNGELGACADGIVAPVTWDLPEIVRRALQNAETVNA